MSFWRASKAFTAHHWSSVTLLPVRSRSSVALNAWKDAYFVQNGAIVYRDQTRACTYSTMFMIHISMKHHPRIINASCCINCNSWHLASLHEQRKQVLCRRVMKDATGLPRSYALASSTLVRPRCSTSIA